MSRLRHSGLGCWGRGRTMDKLKALLPAAARLFPVDWRMEEISTGVSLTLPNGRRQQVRVELRGNRYVLSSVALGQQRAEQIDRYELIMWLWRINRELGVVGLMLDRGGRLV